MNISPFTLQIPRLNIEYICLHQHFSGSYAVCGGRRNPPGCWRQQSRGRQEGQEEQDGGAGGAGWKSRRSRMEEQEEQDGGAGGAGCTLAEKSEIFRSQGQHFASWGLKVKEVPVADSIAARCIAVWCFSVGHRHLLCYKTCTQILVFSK